MRQESLAVWLAFGVDGGATVYSGKVGVGTGVKTARTQSVAGALELAFEELRASMNAAAAQNP